jgi:tripartite-type tricarboxylate transporter receptor subunit TctC
MVAAAMSAVPMASASTSSCSSANGLAINAKTAGSASAAKSICSGLSYYKGKTVTFVAPDNVGGGFDQNARVYAPYLSKYLGATVNVTNIPAGNTVAGMNFVAASNTTNPGLTVGWMNVGPIVEDKVLGITGVNFNAAGESMLGATAPNLTATVAYKSAACAAWDNGFAGLLANNSAAHPVSEPIQTTGSTTFNELILDGVFGIHYHAIPGYASSTQLLSGWVRGDGCVITEPVSTIGSYLAGGTAVALLINVPLQTTNQYYKYFVGVPTYTQAEKQYKKYIVNKTQKAAVPVLNLAGETQRVFFVPPKSPQNEQSALRAAFKWASFNANLKGQLLGLGAPTGYVSGATAKTEYLQYYADTKRVTQYLTALG